MKTSWTTLTADAAAGASTLEVADNVGDWAVGSTILVTGTNVMLMDRTAIQHERHTIASVSGDGMTITLDGAVLAHAHSGSDGFHAEVGLLSHSIVMRGDVPAPTRRLQEGEDEGDDGDDEEDDFEFPITDIDAGVSREALHGGHVIVRKAARAWFFHTEFVHMGQFGILGRYPLHIHLAEEAGANFVASFNSIYDSFSRFVTIHDTNQATFNSNVMHLARGHGVCFEDGGEVNCEMLNNLAVDVIPIVNRAERLVPTDHRPSAYWVVNPINTVDTNVAVGPG